MTKDAGDGPGRGSSTSCHSTERHPGTAASELADRDQLERGFRRLPIEQRAALVMHHYLGLRLPEIAETLGIPEGTARSRLHYATLAMRAVLEADARPAMAAEGGRPA